MGTSQKFRVIFDGRFVPGVPPDEIRENLMKAYRGSAETVERFLSGRRLVIRKDVDYKTALRYQVYMEKAGLCCAIIEEPEHASVPVKPASPAHGPSVTGPKPSVQQRMGSAGAPPPRSEKQPQGDTARRPTGFDGTKRKAEGRDAIRGTPLQNAVAVLMIGLLLVVIGLRLWAIKGAKGIRPPDNVETDGDLVSVHFNKTLYFLDATGRMIRRLNLAKLGISREPADLGLLKNGDVLIGDLDKGEILRCGGAGPTCRRIGPAGGYRINEYFKFLADEERGLLFIADTNNDRLLVQGLDGGPISEVCSAPDIGYPNDMTFDSDGRLWLSDTNNSRVLAFDVSGGRAVFAGKVIETGFRGRGSPAEKRPPPKDIGEALREILERNRRLKNDLVDTRPLALSWDSQGNMWVAASDGLISTAAIKVFDREGGQVRSISLGKSSIPVDLARLGDRMLAADEGLFEISAISAGSGKAAPFGDENFRSEIGRVRDELRRYESVKRWAGLGIWLLAAGAIILAVVALSRRYARGKGPASASGQAARVAEAGAVQRASAQKYRLEFTGTAGEYFRIWIVNVFLTIVTLGIYAAWAKVRTRKYFYRNTILDGQPFDYTADPKAILKGYLIVGCGVAVYSLVRTFNPFYGLAVLGLFGLVIPLLVFKSLRFFTYHSVYRNIRHRFLGTLGESYKTYLFIPLFIPFTLGLIVPYWEFLKKRYFFRNVSYGAACNSFSGKAQPFYPAYIKFGFAATGIIMAGALAGGLFMAAARIFPVQDKGMIYGQTIWMVAWIYGLTLIAVTFSQQYIYAWATNYCLGECELGGIRFESTLQGGRLFWIRVSNVAAIIATLGLLTPWAKVRRMRYIADNITIVGGQNLDDFTAAVVAGESAYGDAATDFFDFEIGL